MIPKADIYNPTWKHYAVILPFFLAIRLLQSTLRLVADKKSVEIMSSPKRMIGVAWHSRIFFLAMCKYYYRDKFPMSGLVSASKDGAYLVAFFNLMGIGSVRGSSKRRGAGAIMGLIDAIENGSDVFITPDGPRGPMQVAKAGFTTVAKESGTRIIAIRITPRHFFTLPSWDKFAIPMPFSKIDIKAIEYENYNALMRDADAEGLAPERLITNYLNSAE